MGHRPRLAQGTGSLPEEFCFRGGPSAEHPWDARVKRGLRVIAHPLVQRS